MDLSTRIIGAQKKTQIKSELCNMICLNVTREKSGLQGKELIFSSGILTFLLKSKTWA